MSGIMREFLRKRLKLADFSGKIGIFSAHVSDIAAPISGMTPSPQQRLGSMESEGQLGFELAAQELLNPETGSYHRVLGGKAGHTCGSNNSRNPLNPIRFAVKISSAVAGQILQPAQPGHAGTNMAIIVVERGPASSSFVSGFCIEVGEFFSQDQGGLGTAGAHRYMDRYAQANDVIYSIPAARAAVPELGQGWVADGHSTGGRAVWGVAEMESKRHDAGYLGSVAVAPGVDLKLMSQLHMAEPVPAGYYFDYLAYAIHRKTPSFQVSDMLTNRSMARFHDVTTKGCYAYTQNHPDDLEPSEKLKPGWEKTEAAERLFRVNEPGQVSLGGPMFIIAGDKDRTIQLVAVKDAVGKACKLGAALNFRIYPGLGHGPTMAKSIPDQLSWIADRFSGKAVETDCGTAGK
jgi:hypothetical protein